MFADLSALLLSSFLVNNIVLVQLLGVSPFFGQRAKMDSAIALAIVTGFVLLAATIINHLLQQFVLTPFDAGYLQPVIFIVVIAALVQGTQLYLQRKMPDAQRALGQYLPLIICNCAVLGLSLNAVASDWNVIESLFASAGAALGFALVLALYVCIDERLSANNTPKAFQGAAIRLISLGLMALAFIGFTGMLPH